MTNSKAKLQRDIEIIQKALNTDKVENFYYPSSVCFEECLMFFSEQELKQYYHLQHKISVIRYFDALGKKPTMHGDVIGFTKKVDRLAKQLDNSDHLSDIDEVFEEIEET